MSSESCEFSHGWVLPHDDRVIRVAVCADQLVRALAKHEVADLTVRLNALAFEAMNSVPKSDTPVVGATAADQ